MTTMTVKYEGGLHTHITHQLSGQDISTDAPMDNGGKGESFSPTDLLASALGSCMLTIMAMKAKDIGVAFDGTSVSVQKIMATSPRRVSEIVVDVYFDHKYDQRTQSLLAAAAKSCPVAQSLHSALQQTIHFHHLT